MSSNSDKPLFPKSSELGDVDLLMQCTPCLCFDTRFFFFSFFLLSLSVIFFMVETVHAGQGLVAGNTMICNLRHKCCVANSLGEFSC